METYITICKINSQQEFAMSQETQTRALYQPIGVGCGGRWEEVQREGIYVDLMADSC